MLVSTPPAKVSGGVHDKTRKGQEMKKTYPVLTAIEHGTTAEDRKRYAPGETIDLDDVDAAPLLAVKAIAEAAETAKKK